jgi:enoyl-CoA hydratase
MSLTKSGLPLLFTQHEMVSFGQDKNIKFRDVIFSGEMMDVQKARKMAVGDENVSEEALLDRFKQVISTCMDTPDQPFLRMKKLLRMDATRRMEEKIPEDGWREGLQGCLLKDAGKTLELVQAGMK